MTENIAYLSLIISLCAAWAAIHQFYINKENLRLNLYDKRFKIYSNVLDIYQELIMYSPSTESKDKLELIHKNFILTLHESMFLFDKSSGICELLKEMNDKVFLIKGNKEYGKEFVGCDPNFVIEKHEEFQQALLWFGSDGILKLGNLLEPYLTFHKITKPTFWHG